MTPHRVNRRWWKATAAAATVGPLIVLPISVYVSFLDAPAWQLMWMLAVSIYAGLKWLTFATCPLARRASTGRAIAYLILWPGMNARQFFDSTSRATAATPHQWVLSILNLALGAVLVIGIAPALMHANPLVAGWVGMVGIVLVLHFGLAHVLSDCWLLAGINAVPIMNFPLLASSLNDLWGRRWNLAFRDAAFSCLFRPLHRRIGVAGATIAVFIASGLIHDLVISLPVNAGWGGPTLYFAVQGTGVLLERSPLGRRAGLGRGLAGRLFCALVTICPVGLLFHQPFILQTILPTLAALQTA